jgi:hypothetical protein
MRLHLQTFFDRYMRNLTFFERVRRRLLPSERQPQTYQTGGRIEGTIQILELLTKHISKTAVTVLDVGCNEGVFSRALAERGYFVVGLEGQKGYVAIGQQAIDSNRTDRIKLLTHRLTAEEIRDLEQTDVILLLSVHHQLVSHLGLETANQMLCDLAGKARQQFFFAPACIRSKYGPGFTAFKDNDYAAIHKYFRDLLEVPGQRRLRFLGDTSNLCPPSEPLRPIFVLEAEVDAPSGAPLAKDGDAIRERSDVFEVSLETCRLNLTQSPHSSGWSYLSATVAEMAQKADIRYEDSILRRYYDKWQPRNWAHILFPGQESQVGLLNQTPVRVYTPALPWAQKFTYLGNQRGQFEFVSEPVPDSEFHSHGPMQPEHGQREFSRIKSVYEKIKDGGYIPELHADGYVRGYFLRRDSEVRFIVTGGQHRVGVLGALGFETFRAKFQPGRARCIDLADVKQWPAVRSGLYSPLEAEHIFNQVFSENGIRIAQYLQNP